MSKRILAWTIVIISSWLFILNPLVNLPERWIRLMFFGKISESWLPNFMEALFPYYVIIGIGIIIDILLIKEIKNEK